jgi:hypothetical protein
LFLFKAKIQNEVGIPSHSTPYSELQNHELTVEDIGGLNDEDILHKHTAADGDTACLDLGLCNNEAGK